MTTHLISSHLPRRISQQNTHNVKAHSQLDNKNLLGITELGVGPKSWAIDCHLRFRLMNS